MSTFKTAAKNIDSLLSEKKLIVNNRLRKLLEEQTQIKADLRKAISYTLEAPGKRIRAALLFLCCDLVCGKINYNAEISASAIEMVHTYSLVHDDLPAMDDDDLRRGRDTCHKVFDEATAILTGDALLTLAFEVLAKHVKPPALAIKLIKELSQAAGPSGLIAGQMADLKAENTDAGKELIEYIHTNKTAKMFGCACASGAVCGLANEKQYQLLCEYGLKIGLGFQIADDVLDVSSTSQQLGKTAGKDITAAKATYPSVFGLEKSRQIAKTLADEAIEILKPFGKDGENLKKLALALAERTS